MGNDGERSSARGFHAAGGRHRRVRRLFDNHTTTGYFKCAVLAFSYIDNGMDMITFSEDVSDETKLRLEQCTDARNDTSDIDSRMAEQQTRPITTPWKA